MAYNAFSEWTKIFGDMKAPSLDINNIVAHYRRNAETGSAVIQIATTSTQEIARRQAEILRSNAEHALKASKEIVGSGNPETAATKQADFAKNWFEFNVNSARELVELSTKSAQEVFDIVNKHVSEQVKELSEVAGTHHNTSKKKAA
ncbi:MAG: TIGR01841 family phasin [Pseudomonadota bacterium]